MTFCVVRVVEHAALASRVSMWTPTNPVPQVVDKLEPDACPGLSTCQALMGVSLTNCFRLSFH